MDETTISAMTIPELLQSKNIYEIQEQPPELREQLKALFFARLDELKASNETKKQIKTMFKQFNEVDKQLAKEYTRANAENNSNIPLAFDGQGKPMTTVDNFLLILRNDIKFQSLKLNLLTYAPEHDVNGTIEKWVDKDDSEARRYIEKKYKIHSEKKLDDALRILFFERSYHPVKQIIKAVEWDGVPRIEKLFVKWLKCVNCSQVSRHKKAHYFMGAGYFVCSQYKASASFGVSILSVPCGLFVL